MLLARRNNSVSNWLNSWFNDNFFDTSLMPHMNATAPAVNVKESATAYTMEVAAPGFFLFYLHILSLFYSIFTILSLFLIRLPFQLFSAPFHYC